MSHNVVGLIWFPGHFGISGNEIADELAREGSVYQFVGPESALRLYRQNIKEKIKCWLVNQHMTL
jgi:ribonuclease HI